MYDGSWFLGCQLNVKSHFCSLSVWQISVSIRSHNALPQFSIYRERMGRIRSPIGSRARSCVMRMRRRSPVFAIWPTPGDLATRTATAAIYSVVWWRNPSSQWTTSVDITVEWRNVPEIHESVGTWDGTYFVWKVGIKLMNVISSFHLDSRLAKCRKELFIKNLLFILHNLYRWIYRI